MKKLTFDPLWKTLKGKGLKKQDLQEKAHLSRGTVTKMGKDEPVSLELIVRICEALDCEAWDVLEIVEDPVHSQSS